MKRKTRVHADRVGLVFEATGCHGSFRLKRKKQTRFSRALTETIPSVLGHPTGKFKSVLVLELSLFHLGDRVLRAKSLFCAPCPRHLRDGRDHLLGRGRFVVPVRAKPKIQSNQRTISPGASQKNASRHRYEINGKTDRARTFETSQDTSAAETYLLESINGGHPLF